jgi:hypothetical protein
LVTDWAPAPPVPLAVADGAAAAELAGVAGELELELLQPAAARAAAAIAANPANRSLLCLRTVSLRQLS